MPPVLRLYEDVLANGTQLNWPALPRLIYVAHGSVAVGSEEVGGDQAWSGEGAADVTAGGEGVTLWRWELDVGERPAAIERSHGAASREKLCAELATLPSGALLLRGDSVAFPPGGCAYLHRHQGPGIRCVLDGGIRIDTHGRSTSYGPGGAWYESGPDPVFAQAADRPTRFIRVLILPQACRGKSSIEYLNEADKTKPKSQSYKLYADMPLTRYTGL